MLFRGLYLLLAGLQLCSTAAALSIPPARTSPPSGSLVVRKEAGMGEYASLGEAVAALPNDGSAQTIFIYPGEYDGQVLLQRNGPVTIIGYSEGPASFQANQVILSASKGAGNGVNNDASATLRIHTDNVKIYNIIIRNDYGPGTQAVALSNQGNHVGIYACQIVGYQDTLLTNAGKHVYLQNYIQGAVDFIFGQRSVAYFEGNWLAVSGSGWITANGRSTEDDGIYLFNHNYILLATDEATTSFGRPWRNYARVIYNNTKVDAPIVQTLWQPWSESTPNTDHVTYGDFGSAGDGMPSNVQRPQWAPELSESQANAYTLDGIMKGDTAWIDSDYLL